MVDGDLLALTVKYPTTADRVGDGGEDGAVCACEARGRRGRGQRGHGACARGDTAPTTARRRRRRRRYRPRRRRVQVRRRTRTPARNNPRESRERAVQQTNRRYSRCGDSSTSARAKSGHRVLPPFVRFSAVFAGRPISATVDDPRLRTPLAPGTAASTHQMHLTPTRDPGIRVLPFLSLHFIRTNFFLAVFPTTVTIQCDQYLRHFLSITVHALSHP